ncbi:helix-turn-helix domain-containing protein [Lentilactobacillus otakiensis]|uniref:MarR family transcriptional regulator n=1 Tax=Lentilactobacillus otakiensis DSM 19908 = JCM 15040 TaxID=1423780 RepID=S4NCQ6_9LACO|nr:helix-turn-helix domain-containing protein [Lentilactobacillus otakiensis]KRL09812.1 MarR family transcriptional regulator [Lentilactobacillus otakiensis DSM 19908 = JCM 15040]MBZ3776158.1 MarR family transcriptional regulator [Lentilactobacillus otakiensis]MDV3517163.1 helix-turn-helix domain-containing protein [Lentilactobacillus otakiensis]GAD16599.1 marR family transcriptional regulator [Lentilactobacillus otakiensis DSM 19908 = JCM 15040]
MSEQIGILLKNINNDLGRYSDREAKKMGITQVQMSIIDFVYRNESKQELYQTDVEREFNIQKSSATALLKLMEKRGLIVRSPSKTDSRYKMILLTARARQFAKKIRLFYDATETNLRRILGDDSDAFIRNLKSLKTFMRSQLD